MSSSRLRTGRCSLPGQAYVLTMVCQHRRAAFEEADAAAIVMAHLQDIDRCGHVQSLAWVVMPDHLHWLLLLRTATLHEVARRFKSSSALAIN
ncbi:transposase [Stenotrophomonas sp.]|uniref:transposase n=1 Tax=Stenotrophomonas sp. TaxID=69392 RepID=UPI002FC6E40C